MGGSVQLQQLEFGRGSQILSVVSGLHGDEYNGLGACARLARFLRQVETQQTPYRLVGRVRLFSASNALALVTGERNWPVDQTDLNRLFPGYVAGEATQRLAHFIYEAVRSSRLCVAVHSGHELVEWPQARSFQDYPTGNQALATGLPLSWVQPREDLRQGSLEKTLQQQGVDCLLLTGGQAQQLDPGMAEQLQAGMVRLALHLGILHGPLLPPVHPPRQVRQVQVCLAERAGLWLPSVRPGDLLLVQQSLGEVVDPLTGELLQLVSTKTSGYVMSLHIRPLVTQGSLLVRVAVV